MNIKSLLALATIATVGAASATVTTTNTLVRIHVASSEASTIVAIPLVAVGTLPNAENPTIAPNNLVLTENLSTGDSILHWNKSSKKWEAWEIQDGNWVSVTTLTSDFKPNATVDAGSAALAMGDAIWVNRTGNLSGGFYIYGQAGTGTTSTAVAATSSVPVYTLLGNTRLADSTITSSSITGSPASGDRIVWGDSNNTVTGVKEYEFNGTEWGRWVGTVTEDDFFGTIVTNVWTPLNETIPAGQGVWYVSFGGSATITW